MRRRNHWAVGLLAGGLLLGCGPQVGSNTSWFRACDADADCNDELACLCGACTATCSSETDCGPGLCGDPFTSLATCPDSGGASICVSSSAEACASPVDEEFALGAPGSTDCAPTALVCETFDGSISDSYRVIEEEHSLLFSQSCFGVDGGGSLTRIGTPADYGHVTIPLSAPVSTGTLHARFYTYLPTETQLPLTAMLLRLHAGPEPEGQVVTLRFRSDLSVGLNFFVDAPTEYSSEAVLTRGQWQCVELTVEVSEVGHAEVAINGNSVLQVEMVDTLDIAAPYDAVRVLGATAADGSYFDVAFDELVVATEPIGCL